MDRQYYAGEAVTSRGHLFTCTEDHFSAASNAPNTTNAPWQSQIEIRVEPSHQGIVLGALTSPSSTDDLQTISLSGWMYGRGPYATNTSYHPQNVVTHAGRLWQCLLSNGTGNLQTPGSAPTYWRALTPAPRSTAPKSAGNQGIASSVTSSQWTHFGSLETGDIPQGAPFTIRRRTTNPHPTILDWQFWPGSALPQNVSGTETFSSGWPVRYTPWSLATTPAGGDPTEVRVHLAREGTEVLIYFQAGHDPAAGDSFEVTYLA